MSNDAFLTSAALRNGAKQSFGRSIATMLVSGIFVLVLAISCFCTALGEPFNVGFLIEHASLDQVNGMYAIHIALTLANDCLCSLSSYLLLTSSTVIYARLTPAALLLHLQTI